MMIRVVVASVAVIALAGCPQEPRERPDVACADTCKIQLSSRCGEHDCERGCAFVLDRLVEHEQIGVLACVKAASACDDNTWAACAANIGVHADGGPALPAPAATE